LAGLLLALPARQATGLLSCAGAVFGCLRSGFTAWTPCSSKECCGPWPATAHRPQDGTSTVRLDPRPTWRATTAVTQLCEHLTGTQTRYPGTNLILRYEIKTRC